MCIICIELQKEKLTLLEARRNFFEMSEGLGSHAREVDEILSKREFEKMLEQFIEEIEFWVTD